MEYNFAGLNASQARILTRQGWEKSESRNRPQLRIVNPLLERGLIQMVPIAPGSTYPQAYIVPIPVHAAWCEYCAASPAKRLAEA